MRKYKSHLSYEDSGVEWLGELPRHWGLDSSKWVFSERKEKAVEGAEQLTASQKYGVISQKEFMEREQQKVVQVYKGHEILKQAEAGDFVISMRSFQGGIEFSPFSGAVSSAYVPLVPRKVICSSYYKYLFKCNPYIQALQTTSNLVRDGQALRYSNFAQVILPSVPLAEQQKIAEFLDYETAKIDTLIEKQQQLIKLLKEKRQAVISHAVTKGLNPNAPMKDSGVEWLGEVPKHWVVSRVKFEYKNLDGRRIPLSTEERSYKQGEYPYYGASGIIDHVDEYIFDKDLVLVSEDGANLLMRTSPIAFPAYGKYWVNNHAHILQPKDNNTEYWAEVIEVRDLTPYISGSAQPKFTSEALSNLEIAVSPDDRETNEIASYITMQKEKYSLLINKAKSSVMLLQERRTALISAAVTGKIDVRDWQAPKEQQQDSAA